jgi:hypothetical protein
MEERFFAAGDIVLTKYPGFGFWPAQVSQFMPIFS